MDKQIQKDIDEFHKRCQKEEVKKIEKILKRI